MLELSGKMINRKVSSRAAEISAIVLDLGEGERKCRKQMRIIC